MSFPITIYHNPKCGTSRNVVELVRGAGHEPQVVEYLQAGWSKPQLQELLKLMDAKPQDILRSKGTPAEEMGLLTDGVSDDVILEAMIAHPILVNRPIVVTPNGVKLCRPSETVLAFLEKS
jgi:arsenate reductase